MTDHDCAASVGTPDSDVRQTFTLWLWPYFCLREEARPVLSGLTKAKADEIMEREKDRAPGVMFLEPDDMPNAPRQTAERSGASLDAVVGNSE